jgi:hypothetical protein
MPARIDSAQSDTLTKRLGPDPRLIWICIAGIAAVFGYLLVYHVHHEGHGGGHLGDFPTFYMAAEYARDHRDIYTAGHRETDQMYVYPPLIAFLYIPLTHLSLPHAAMVMLFLTVAMLLASLFLGTQTMLHRLDSVHPLSICAVACMVSILSENEMRGELTMLETDALMLLMFTLALYWLDRFPTFAGLALAFAFNIKYLSIIALPYLILRRRWKAAGAMVAGTVLFALLPALQLGWKEDIRCLRVSMGGLLRWVGIAPETSHSITVHNIADGLSVSITSALARALGARGFTNPQIMAVATGVGIAALAIVAILYRMNGIPFWKWPASVQQVKQPFEGLVALEWAGLVTVAIEFSPDTNTRHLVLAMLVNILGAVLVLVRRPGIRRLPALVGVILIFLGFTMPGARTLRHMGFNHFVYGIPCWFLLIGYLLILWTGLRFVGLRRQTFLPPVGMNR